MSKPYLAILLLIVLSLVLHACGDPGTTSSGGSADTATPAERTERQDVPPGNRSGDKREDRAGGRSGDQDGQGVQEGDLQIQSATLELSGDEGTGFSGVCSVGEEEIEVEGTVPRSLNLDLNGEPLRCEIENTGAGALTADLTVGNSHYIQQTTSQGATLNFALSGDGYSSSTSSVTIIESKTPDAVSNASSYADGGSSSEQ